VVTDLVGVLHRNTHHPVDPVRLRAIASRGEVAGQVAVTSGEFGVLVSGEAGSLWREDTLVVAADADVLNLDELRLLTGRDTAPSALAALYRKDGAEVVRRLRGAFAFALWDSQERHLVLAVDPLGMRRLYYTVTSQGLAFASRAGALRAFPGAESEPDPTAVYCYLNFGFVPAPYSTVPGVHRLEPGSLLTVEAGTPRVHRYWDLAYAERRQDVDQARQETRRLAEAAVARALGDTGTKHAGAFLSGGTDSSTVLGLMTRLTGDRVNAFSIGFHERRYDELAYAERAARHFEAIHHVHRVSPSEALDALPRIIETYDEPFGNNSAIGTFLCARLARECGVTLLLAGDGGDEIFGGNERYTIDRIFARYHRVPGLLRRAALEPLLFALPEGGTTMLGKAQRYVRRANLGNPRRFYSYEFFFAQDGQRLLAPEFLRTIEPRAPWALLEGYFARATASEELNRLLYLDMKLTIGDDDLLKVTRTVAAAGLAVRFPFLDLPLVEFTTTWPARFKVRGTEKRWLFRRTFKNLLPAETLAKRKHGFGVPTSLWLRTHQGFVDLMHDALVTSSAHVTRYLRPGAIEELLRLHASDATPFYGDILWNVLMLEMWYRHHVRRGTDG
jgi:asparagine synthase (glutamine-hydrolysing)